MQSRIHRQPTESFGIMALLGVKSQFSQLLITHNHNLTKENYFFNCPNMVTYSCRHTWRYTIGTYLSLLFLIYSHPSHPVSSAA